MMELDIEYYFGSGLYHAIYNSIRYRISEKSGLADIISHNFARIRIDSYNSLLIEFSC